MERLNKIQHKAPKQAKKAKREPIKVVYISNPMRVFATAAEFRARVQELTGRDSDVADTYDFPMLATTHDSPVATDPVLAAYIPDNPVSSDPGSDHGVGFDDAFNTWMMENFHGFMPTSTLFDPSPIGAFRGIDQE